MMEEQRCVSKVISICGNAGVYGKEEYAINLASALVVVTGARVLFIDVGASCNSTISSEIGLEVSSPRSIKKQYLEKIRHDYGYVIVSLPPEIDELTYEIFSCSDTIHFFVNSTKDSLNDTHVFLEDLLRKGLKDAHSRSKVIVNRLNIFDRFSVEEMSWLLKRDVWAIVPEPGILEALIDSKGIPLVFKSKDSAYQKAVVRIAKSESDKLLGLALGSGAAFGIAHIGVLKVLEQHRIPIDVLSGSSMGGLIAVLWGLGFSSDKIEYIARKLRNKLNIMRLLDFTIPISGILAGRRLKRFLRSILGEKTFEDLQIPVKIMVYDLANRETLAIENGLLVDAVYMSIAVPGIFEPTIEKERMIVDGGVSDPVPVDILLKQGATKIIAVNVLPGPEDIYEKNRLLKKKSEDDQRLRLTSRFYIKIGMAVRDFFRRIFTPNIFDVIMTSMQSIEYTLAENSCKKARIALHPVVPDANSIDFHLVKDFIKRGEEEAVSHIDEIKALIRH